MSCDNTKNTPKSCCAGLYCSPKTNSCSCIEEKNPCGGLHNPYKCCPGLKCLDGGCYKNSEKGCSDNGRGCEKNDNCCSKNCIAGFCKCSGKDGACEVTIDCCDGLKCSNGKCNKI
ncbi:hypothetical protein ACQ4LE_000085 [Meloidogyne hapla]